jgi:hypothetical protein
MIIRWEFEKHQEREHFSYQIELFKGKIYKRIIVDQIINSDQLNRKRKSKLSIIDLFELYKMYKNASNKTRNYRTWKMKFDSNIHLLRWDNTIYIGLADVPFTASLSGIIWWMNYQLLSFLHEKMNTSQLQTNINVNPIYQIMLCAIRWKGEVNISNLTLLISVFSFCFRLIQSPKAIVEWGKLIIRLKKIIKNTSSHA